jgi:hypothetical protein
MDILHSRAINLIGQNHTFSSSRDSIHETSCNNLTVIIWRGFLTYKKQTLKELITFVITQPSPDGDHKKFVRNLVNISPPLFVRFRQRGRDGGVAIWGHSWWIRYKSFNMAIPTL